MKRKLKTNCSIVRLFDCGLLQCVIAVALCAVGLTAFAGSEIAAVSAEGELDLTIGDRVAKDAETLVVDPAWNGSTEATVQIDGEPGARSYTTASNDTWQTAALTPGRYALALTAGADEETAAFWKIGADWVVLDLPPYSTEGIEFQSNTTYLALGAYEFASGKPLIVKDGAKFEYGKGAGFKGGASELPKRYETKTVGDLYQIVEKIKGCENNPWDVGEGVTASTNGTELVIGGAGTLEDLSEIPGEIKGGIEVITIADAKVTGAAPNAFQGVGTDGSVTLTLPDGWQGELPDEKDNWCGATNVTLTRMPLTVRNVKVATRYPWNGLVDITFDLTGAGVVNVAALVTTNGVKAVAKPTVTGETTFDLGDGGEQKGLKLIWDAKTDFGDEGVHEKIKVKLTVEPTEK